MKHTDGPWEIRTEWSKMTNEIHGNIDGGYGDDGSQIRSTLICEVNIDCDEWKQNAKLISIAPDLLDALIELSAFTASHSGAKYLGTKLQQKVQRAINRII